MHCWAPTPAAVGILSHRLAPWTPATIAEVHAELAVAAKHETAIAEGGGHGQGNVGAMAAVSRGTYA